MALKNYVERTATVEIPDNEPLVVRGFSMPDVLNTISAQKELAEDLFKKLVSGEVDAQDTEQLVIMLFDQFAPVLGQIIANAAGEPDEWETAIRLPLSVQADALQKIIELTFESMGGPGKFLEALQNLLDITLPR